MSNVEMCPRCAGLLLDEDDVSDAPFRSAGGEPICGDCVLDETYRHALGGPFIPAEQWPMDRPHDYLRSHDLDPKKPF
ncbi:hypothetical protein [Microbacterium sp.]|uniref:hypothetical protein n=1 Tax=Microbacterium sp. TaxID=51671 RepID=UPI00391B587A